jgi:hypothetical protein
MLDQEEEVEMMSSEIGAARWRRAKEAAREGGARLLRGDVIG